MGGTPRQTCNDRVPRRPTKTVSVFTVAVGNLNALPLPRSLDIGREKKCHIWNGDGVGYLWLVIGMKKMAGEWNVCRKKEWTVRERRRGERRLEKKEELRDVFCFGGVVSFPFCVWCCVWHASMNTKLFQASPSPRPTPDVELGGGHVHTYATFFSWETSAQVRNKKHPTPPPPEPSFSLTQFGGALWWILLCVVEAVCNGWRSEMQWNIFMGG